MRKWWLTILSVGVVAVAFQNCAKPRAGEATSPSDEGALVYPYKTAPDFYYDIAAFRPPVAGSTLTQFQVQVAAQYYARPDLPLAYKVEVLTTSGSLVCPEKSGSLAAGLSTVQLDCVTAVGVAHFKVRLSLTANAVSGVYEKQF